MAKYLIDIPHPHFVHFFKNIIKELGADNVVITCQDSGIITKLLESNGIPYIVLGKKYKSIFSKGIGQFLYLKKYITLIRKNKIDVLLGMAPSTALAARLTGKQIVFFDDDDSAVQPLTKKITVPLSNIIITPKCLEFENYGKNHLTYKGFQELAYLAPKYFIPDLRVIEKYNLKAKSYFILRFNDFHAHHDSGHSGIPKEIKKELVHLLEKHGNVFITAESTLDSDFQKYQLKVEPTDIHHVLAFAKMYIGDSQTMTSEAAVLGTPSIRCNTFKNKISYLNELEYVHQLTYAFLPDESANMVVKINDLLNLPNLEQEWDNRKTEMLSKMEDVNENILKTLKSLKS